MPNSCTELRVRADVLLTTKTNLFRRCLTIRGNGSFSDIGSTSLARAGFDRLARMKVDECRRIQLLLRFSTLFVQPIRVEQLLD